MTSQQPAQTEEPEAQDDRMQVWLTARPEHGDILIGMDRKTDAIFMDAQSAMTLSKALQDAVMLLEGNHNEDPEH